LKNFIKNSSFFLLAFGLSKACVFFAPLLLSNTLSENDYGSIEFALNIGFIGSALIGLGVKSAYPYFKLKRQYKTLFEGFKFHYLYLLISNIILIFIVTLVANSPEYLLSVLFVYTLSNQGLLSIIMKTDEKIITAVILDSLLYVFLLLAFLYMSIFTEASISIIIIFTSCYAILYTLNALKNYKFLTTINYRKHNKLIKYGRNVLISGILILLIANSGRLLIEYLFDDKKLIGVFSFYFRMASFVLIFHQIVSIIYFKKIYTYDVSKLDGFLCKLMLCVVIFSIITFFVVPEIGRPYFKLFESFNEYKMIYMIFCFQMFYWILLANLESVIYRENLAFKMNIGLIFLLAMFLGLVLLFQKSLNFNKAVFILYILIFSGCLLEFYTLFKYKKIKLIKTFLLSLLVFLISLMCLVV
jgi:O-antigen/teichoic acid export membrane protein